MHMGREGEMGVAGDARRLHRAVPQRSRIVPCAARWNSPIVGLMP
jgi:hypothetical protein